MLVFKKKKRSWGEAGSPYVLRLVRMGFLPHHYTEQENKPESAVSVGDAFS